MVTMNSQVPTVGAFLNQRNRLAKFLTWIWMLHMNRAQSDGAVPGPKQASKQPFYQSSIESIMKAEPTWSIRRKDGLSGKGILPRMKPEKK